MKFTHYTSASIRKRKGKGWQGILKYKDEDNKWKSKYKTFPDAELKARPLPPWPNGGSRRSVPGTRPAVT